MVKVYLMKPEYSAIDWKYIVSYPLLVYLLLNKEPSWASSKCVNSIMFSLG